MWGEFTIPLNVAPGVYHLDDATLYYEDLQVGWAEPAAAAARIEAGRKGNFSLSFADGASGVPLGAGVLTGANVTLLRNEFAFGTTYDPITVCVWGGSVPWARECMDAAGFTAPHFA